MFSLRNCTVTELVTLMSKLHCYNFFVGIILCNYLLVNILKSVKFRSRVTILDGAFFLLISFLFFFFKSLCFIIFCLILFFFFDCV